MTVKRRPKWYLKEVKELQNHPWTDREKLAVYAFRTEIATPVEIVARAFGASKIQIYNITRIVKKSKKEECFSCGKHLSAKELKQKKLIKSCDICKEHHKEYKRKRREKLLKQGICGYCEKRKVVPGKSS